MFKLTKQEVKLTSILNQKHYKGDEKVPAVCCTFTGTFPNEILRMFPGDLLHKLFREKKEEDKDLADKGTDGALTELNLDHVKTDTLELDYEADSYRMVISYGISGDNDIVLINSSLDKFKIKAIDGGVVDLKFNLVANVHRGDCHETAELHVMLDEMVTLTLEPPSAVDMLDQVA